MDKMTYDILAMGGAGKILAAKKPQTVNQPTRAFPQLALGGGYGRLGERRCGLKGIIGLVFRDKRGAEGMDPDG